MYEVKNDDNNPLKVYEKMVQPMSIVKLLSGCSGVLSMKNNNVFPRTINTVMVANVLMQCLKVSRKEIAVQCLYRKKVDANRPMNKNKNCKNIKGDFSGK